VEFPFPTVEIVEGRARLLVPDVPRRRGPNPRGPWPFYNPTMAVSRDLSALALARWPVRLESVLDGLAATGAWGIRMGLEAGAGGLVFNDRSPDAAALIRSNVDRNGLSAEVLSEELRSLLAARSFDFVDIDPFGPPTPFLGAALRRTPPGSGLGITATDTAPLCGTYPRACERRYVARPLRCDQGHEIGLRILLGYIERVAEVHDKVVRPLLAFAAEHFFRVHVLVLDASHGPPPDVGYVARDASGAFVRADSMTAQAIGPLWLGPLLDAAFVRTLAPSTWTGVQAQRLLDRLQHEADLPPFFVTTDELARREGRSPPRLADFLLALRDAGYRAERTHFHPRGVKTDAPVDEVLRLFRATASGSRGGSGPAS